MKPQFASVLLIISSLFGLTAGAKAQAHPEVIVKIPYEFVAGGRTLPAGTYTVSRLSDGRLAGLRVVSYEQRTSVVVFPFQFENRSAEDAKISLEHVGGMYFLRTIETPDGVYTLSLPRSAVLMAKSAHADVATASGTH